MSFDDGAHALTLATSLANHMKVDEKAGSVNVIAANTITNKSGANSIEISNGKETNSISLISGKTITLTCGQSSITLNTNGTIEITGVNVVIKGTASVSTTGGTISTTTGGVHTIKGGPVDIN